MAVLSAGMCFPASETGPEQHWPRKVNEMAKATLKKKKVTLNFQAETGRDVYVAGSFNNWDLDDEAKGNKVKKLKEKESGQYSINMFLPLGEYEYKFFCDGKWFADAQAQDQIPNGFGTFNSVLKVA